MATLDQREVVTGRREPSDSALPLVVQKRQIEDAAAEVASKASEAFSKTLLREMKRISAASAS
jgi:hypothetical protein